MITGIYRIYNTANEKIYIGASENVHYRIESHKNELYRNRHSNRRLQKDWDTYGESAFEFSIIEVCEISKLNERENYWIAESITNGKAIYNKGKLGGYSTGIGVYQRKREITTFHVDKLKEIAELTRDKSVYIPSSIAQMSTLRFFDGLGFIKLHCWNYGRITQTGMQFIDQYAE